MEPLIKDTSNKGHLSIKDKTPIPNVSFIQRFHYSVQTLLRYYVFDNLAKTVKTARKDKESLTVDTRVSLYTTSVQPQGITFSLREERGRERQSGRGEGRERVIYSTASTAGKWEREIVVSHHAVFM